MTLPPSIAAIDRLKGVQRQAWIVARVGWFAMATLVVLAVAGLFGEGPLSRATARADHGSLVVDYDRFQRTNASSRMRLTGFDTTGDNRLTFCLDRDFVAVWRLGRIEPVAYLEEVRGSDVCFINRGGALAGTPASIRLWLIPRHPTPRARGRIYTPGGAAVSLQAVVWP